MSESVFCPSCRREEVTAIGPIPICSHFCALDFEHPVNPGSLYECRECGLWFRDPCLTAGELLALYAAQPDAIWSSAAEHRLRVDHQVIISHLNRHWEGSSGAICDIGCYTGDLLSDLRIHLKSGSSLTFYGIEPSTAAAQVAQSRSVSIIGANSSALRSCKTKFDVICAVDVFEHLQDTGEFIADCKAALAAGGRLIIVTGAMDSAFNQRWKNISYYVTMPEHVAFINRRHAMWLAQTHGMVLREYTLFNRSVSSILTRLRLFGKAVVLLVGQYSPMAMKLVNSRIRGIPNWNNQADHVLVVLTLPG